MKKILLILVVAAVAASAVQANVYLKPGDSLEATINYVQSGTTVYTSTNDPVKSGNVYIGYGNINITKVNGVDLPDWTVRGYCIDLYDLIGNGEFDVVATATAPLDDGDPTKMGDDKALLLGKLFAYKYEEVGTGNLNAAFQVAVWEIVYEDSGSLGLLDGDFSISNTTVAATASEWLAAITTGDAKDIVPMGNIALVSTGTQDWVIPNVPAPGALLLGTMGMGLVGWLRRRRTL